MQRRDGKSQKEITETVKKNRSSFLCDLGEKTSTSFPHLLLERELQREANFPCLTWQEDIIPTLFADQLGSQRFNNKTYNLWITVLLVLR